MTKACTSRARPSFTLSLQFYHHWFCTIRANVNRHSGKKGKSIWEYSESGFDLTDSLWELLDQIQSNMRARSTSSGMLEPAGTGLQELMALFRNFCKQTDITLAVWLSARVGMFNPQKSSDMTNPGPYGELIVNRLPHTIVCVPAAAKSLQSCPLCDPIDGSPPGSPVSGILQARILEWVAISFSLCVPESESEVAQSCPTLWDPVDCSLPGSSVHGILQARILEWVAISFSRGSSRPRDQTQVSRIAGRCFNLWATREAPLCTEFFVNQCLTFFLPNIGI